MESCHVREAPQSRQPEVHRFDDQLLVDEWSVRFSTQRVLWCAEILDFELARAAIGLERSSYEEGG